MRERCLHAYISLPMIHVRDFEFNRRYIDVVESLGVYVISKWVAVPPAESKLAPGEVFKRDILGILSCDILIADVTFPSHGVGMELMCAYALGRRIIVTYRRGTRISYMILGLPTVTFIEYEDLEDLKSKMKKILQG